MAMGADGCGDAADGAGAIAIAIAVGSTIGSTGGDGDWQPGCAAGILRRAGNVGAG